MLFTPPSSPSVVMPSDIVVLPAADAEVLKQRLDALVVDVEAAEEKAATARRRVLAARQLLDEEQAAAADLERQAAAKKLVSGYTSFSTTETAIASSSYVDTIITNLHIQADTMMEEIHLDISGPAAAPTAFYSNKTPSTPLSPPGKNNGSGPGNGNGSNNNRHRNNNRRNGGSGGKNNDNGGNHSGNTSSNTTVISHGATTNDGRGPRHGRCVCVRNRTLTRTLIEREDDTRSWGNFLVYFSLYHNVMPSKGLGIHTYRLLASQEYARC
jgi:hypothetical protein